MKPHQLALSIRLHDHTRLENFISEDDGLIERLKEIVLAPSHQYAYVWGYRGVGKTHLLCALNHYCQTFKRKSLYLNLQEPDLTPSLLDEVDGFEVILIDDLDFVIEKPHWQEALFHLYNRAQGSDTVLVTSALTLPKGLGLSLKDLESRLTWGAVLQINSLSDEKKRQLLSMRANAQGMILSAEVIQYMLTHLSRSNAELLAILDMLERRSLEQKRKITIPFLKSLLCVN